MARGLDHAEPRAADPPAPGESPGELLDQAALGELRDLAPEDFREILELYLADAPPQLRSVVETLERGDASAAAAAAHRLKGESLAVGASLVAELAAELETRARSNDVAGAAELLVSLEHAVLNTAVAVRAELSSEREGAPTP